MKCNALKRMKNNSRSCQDLQVTTFFGLHQAIYCSVDGGTAIVDGNQRENIQDLLHDNNGVVDMHKLSRYDTFNEALDGNVG